MPADYLVSLSPQLPPIMIYGSSGTIRIQVDNIGDAVPTMGRLTASLQGAHGIPPLYIRPGTCAPAIDNCDSATFLCGPLPIIPPGESFSCTLELYRNTVPGGNMGTYLMNVQANLTNDSNWSNNRATVSVVVGEVNTLPLLHHPIAWVALLALMVMATMQLKPKKSDCT